MISLHKIETAIATRLKNAGHIVTAAEVDEGFVKPTFFIDIFQNSVTAVNYFMEYVSVGVELRYIPETETREVLVDMSDKLRDLFMSSPIKVVDRYLSIYEVTFETDKTALLCYFELEFMRETNKKMEDSVSMENLEWEDFDLC